LKSRVEGCLIHEAGIALFKFLSNDDEISRKVEHKKNYPRGKKKFL